MNKARLRYEMAIQNISVGKMCEALGISRSAFYRKCSEKSEFTLTEIQKIIDFLHLKSPVGIFFTQKVS